MTEFNRVLIETLKEMHARATHHRIGLVMDPANVERVECGTCQKIEELTALINPEPPDLTPGEEQKMAQLLDTELRFAKEYAFLLIESNCMPAPVPADEIGKRGRWEYLLIMPKHMEEQVLAAVNYLKHIRCLTFVDGPTALSAHRFRLER